MENYLSYNSITANVAYDKKEKENDLELLESEKINVFIKLKNRWSGLSFRKCCAFINDFLFIIPNSTVSNEGFHSAKSRHIPLNV